MYLYILPHDQIRTNLLRVSSLLISFISIEMGSRIVADLFFQTGHLPWF